MGKNGKNEPVTITSYRWKLALTLIIISISGIGVVAGLAIGFAAATDKATVTQMVFTAVVPLLASWVGAVIAYYFSSESMDAATRSVKELMPVEEKLKSIPVSKVMIKIADMVKFTDDDTQKVQAVLATLKEKNKGERLPFLDKDKKPVYMLHKSAVNDAIVECGSEIKIGEVTLQQLFEKIPSLKVMALGSFGTLGQDATLENARDEMNRINNCQDVYITEKGDKNSAVIGWITNVIIEENSKL